jgi:hypothetical protein
LEISTRSRVSSTFEIFGARSVTKRPKKFGAWRIEHVQELSRNFTRERSAAMQLETRSHIKRIERQNCSLCIRFFIEAEIFDMSNAAALIDLEGGGAGGCEAMSNRWGNFYSASPSSVPILPVHLLHGHHACSGWHRRFDKGTRK